MDSEVSALAEAAARALATAVNRDVWPQVRSGFLQVFAGQEEAAEVLQVEAWASPLREIPVELSDEALARLLARWIARLRLLLEDNQGAVPRLRQFVDEVSHLLPDASATQSVHGVVQHSVTGNVVLGGSINVYGAGRDIRSTG